MKISSARSIAYDDGYSLGYDVGYEEAYALGYDDDLAYLRGYYEALKHGQNFTKDEVEHEAVSPRCCC